MNTHKTGWRALPCTVNCSITSIVTSFVTTKIFVMIYELRNGFVTKGAPCNSLVMPFVTRLAEGCCGVTRPAACNELVMGFGL